MIPVILSGGSGTRLWPLSRALYPKQFLPLLEERSLFQATVARLARFDNCEPPIVVCNHEHRFLVAEQLRLTDEAGGRILLEPQGRDTAPAVALAAMEACAAGDDPLLLVMPADHLIKDTEKFQQAVAQGVAFAEAGALVTFGIAPAYAHTGYGYIRRGKPVDNKPGGYAVSRFVEKPDQSRAQQYVDSGEYYWNSGMFLFRASVYLHELAQHAPQIVAACEQAMAGISRDEDFLRLDEAAFAQSPSDSIDVALMEKTDKAVVLPLHTPWNDVGSWKSLWEEGERDANDNVVSGDVVLEDVKRSLVHSDNRLVAAVGVEDLIIVETGDALLVMHKERTQEVKKIVSTLQKNGRSEAMLHRRVPRPWGAYECIDVDVRFQVKKITVKPGAKLSLQLHHHRAEHWVVVTGTAKITRGDEVFVLGENQSTFIPLGVQHRLENPGKIPLELIEVQSGSYLGEDDIVRLDDSFGRVDV